MFLSMPLLEVLDLSFNAISVLPPEIGRVEGLRELWLGGNPLQGLPDLSELRRLELLDLGGCQIQALSPTLFRKLHRLNSLSLASNPLGDIPPSLGLRSNIRVLVLDGLDLGPGTGDAVQAYVDAARALRAAHGYKPVPGISLLEAEIAMLAGRPSSEDHENPLDGLSTRSSNTAGTLVNPSTLSPVPRAPSPTGRASALRARHRAFRRLMLHLRDCHDLDDAARRAAEVEKEEASRARRGQITRTGSFPVLASDADSSSFGGGDGASEFGVPLSMLGLGRGGSSTPVPGKPAAPAAPVKKVKPPEFRAALVREILSTERTYVQLLRNLMELYVVPLEGGPPGSGNDRILSKEEHARIFQNVGSLLGLHSDFILPNLTRACDDYSGRVDPPNVQPPSLRGRIGRCFLQYAAFLKLYSVYYNGFDAALAMLEKLDSDKPPPAGRKDPMNLPTPAPKTVKRFRQHVERARQSPNHRQINLQAWLLLPVQRLPRYKMLLEKLWECTDASHPDNEDLEKAMEELALRVRECNERKREWEGVTSVVEGVLRQIRAPEEDASPLTSGSASPASSVPGSPSPGYQPGHRARPSGGIPARGSSLALSPPPGSPGSPQASLTTLTTGAGLLRIFSARRKLLKAAPWRAVRVVVRAYVPDAAVAAFVGLPQAPEDVLSSPVPPRSDSNLVPPAVLVRPLGSRIKEAVPLLPTTVIPAAPREAGRDDELILFADVLLWCRPLTAPGEGQERYELVKAFDLDRAGDQARGVARVVDAADLPFALPGIGREDEGKLLRISDPGGECVAYFAGGKEGEAEGEAFADAVNFGGAV
ncbi:hypothetical protein DFJ74DRAFT_454487 [Hyaloraphidium curvatum]|nr:hypothetical protein DFJ74DRAFT_454487 [Hyaloraphidium curvatum]